MENLILNTDGMETAVGKLQNAISDEEMRLLAFAYEKNARDERARLHYAEQKGLAEGIQIGEARGIEIGEARGIEIGEARGEARGKAEGEILTKRKFIRKILPFMYRDELVEIAKERIELINDSQQLEAIHDAILGGIPFEELEQMF